MKADKMKTSLNVTDGKAIFEALSKAMAENRQLLTDLDADSGDGDLGITMTKGFAAAAKTAQDFAEDDVGRLLFVSGMAIARSAPSTLGTLIASGFTRCSKGLIGRRELTTTDCAVMMANFVEGIMDRGKSKPGEKTIVDTLLPAAKALGDAPAEAPLADAWAAAVSAAERGLEKSKHMKAQHGRAAYYGDTSIGKQDPGATVGLVMVRTIAGHLR
jgi:phosphoenolpyruvate---glycerone phosphotransferase subunit DhaL